MTSKLVSIIIPTFNRGALVSRAVASVLSQSYSNLECIVVDDASTDDTLQRLSRITDPRFRYIRHDRNQYVCVARNTGIEAANGEYIAFLDSDDEWLPDKLALQVALLESLPVEFGMVYCWMDYISSKTGQSVRKYCPEARGDIFVETLDAQPIGNASTLVIRRCVLNEVHGFDVDLPRGNDSDFIRRVAKHYHVDFVPKILVNYYVDHESQRITTDDRKGFRNKIKGKLDKLEKFSTEYAQHPDRHFNMLCSLAECYIALAEVRSARKVLVSALKIKLDFAQLALAVGRGIRSYRSLRAMQNSPKLKGQ